MHDLKELAYIVTKNKLKSIEILDSNSSSRMMEFYSGIVSGTFQTDEEAAFHFFGPGYKNGGYNKFKKKLKKKLLNTLFFIDVKQPSYNERQKAYYECHKDWAAANILFGKNAHTAGIELSHQILKHALRYEFTELALGIMYKLRLYYATHVGNFNKYNYYKELCNEFQLILSAERIAENLYLDLTINYVNNKSSKKQISEAAFEAYEELTEYLEKFDSYNLHLYGALIRLIIHSSINDNEATLKVCDDIITFYNNKDYAANTPLQIAYYQQLVCYTQLRKHKEGKKAADSCLELIVKGSFNWFKYHELYLILALHTKQYNEAFLTFKTVRKHSRFKFLPENIQEIWKIFEAYLCFILMADEEISDENAHFFINFRLAKFINDTPIFAKDKAGLNISILIIQILFLIHQKKYNEIIDKAEAIDKYCSRYLKKEETIRAYYFIKMLLIIQKSSFDKIVVLKKADFFTKKLYAIPYEVANQEHNIEIIPYEILWKYALAALTPEGQRNY